MRILMTTDTVGGVLTYTAELAAALRASGDELVVATLGEPLRDDQRARLPAEVHETTYALEWMEDPWDDVAASGRWLADLAAAVQPDVVHLCSYAHGALELPAPKVVVGHSCVASWWCAMHGTEPPPEWDRYRRAVAAGLAGADAVVAPTAAMLSELERLHGARNGIVIHNGTAVPPAPADAHKRPLVLGAGRFWDPAKNLAALDEAARRLPWPVTVAGDVGSGPAPRHARATGPLPAGELAALRRQAAIFAAPARYEPFGLAALEAARDRCALVLGDLPSLREVWGDAAVFVDPLDPAALRDALEALIADPVRRAEMAGRAQRRAAAFGIDRTARAYRRLYARLAARAAPGVAA